jgi:hypothetical protein
MNNISEELFKDALYKEDDLGSVIRVHLHIEHHVNEIIHLLAPSPDYLKQLRLDYDGKITLLCLLGLKPDSIKVLSALGKMRNKFAHNLNYQLDESTVKSFYETLDSYSKKALQKSYDDLLTNGEYQGLDVYKKLTPRNKFIVISTFVKNMVLRIKVELSNPVQ